MRRLSDRIETIAQSDAPVLITGESGTGKELVARDPARAQHARATKPFVAVNCARLPRDADRGRAVRSRARRVHRRGQAPRRALQGRRRRHAVPRRGRRAAAVGAGQAAARAAGGDVRAARHQRRSRRSTCASSRRRTATCSERIREGQFREDLYYRLNVLDIEIPPLRERRGDLPLLLQHFLQQFTPAGKARVRRSRRAPGRRCRSTRFPGNVREFSHAIEHAVVLSGGGEIDVEHLPAGIAGTPRRRRRARRAATSARSPRR